MSSDQTLTRWLFRRLQSQWPQLRREWSAMLTELEYGFDPTRGMLAMSRSTKPLEKGKQTFEFDAGRSWQATGVQVSAGDEIQIEASGDYSVATEPKPWRCQPPGVTLEYYRGEPLGKLMMTVTSPMEKEQFSQPIDVIAVGDRLQFSVKQSGELHFRVNESSGGLADNEGKLRVSIERQ